MIRHDIAWVAPQPFWPGAAAAVAPQQALAVPQILRFASDDFMPELLAQLEHEPASLARYAVYKETWRGPAGAPAADPQRWLQREPRKLLDVRRLVRRRAGAAPAGGEAAADTAPLLKLYQPAHMRHYLVAGSLVCRTSGLPDRHVDPARQKVSFVLRRLFPVDMKKHGHRLPEPKNLGEWEEHAYLPQGKAGVWRSMGPASDAKALAQLLPGEERLAMFPSHFTQDDGHPRRLYVGSVPVGRREVYQAAMKVPADPEDAPPVADPRVALFHTQVLGPWRALVNRVMRNTLGNSYVEARPDLLFEADEDSNEIPPGARASLSDRGRVALHTAHSAFQTSSWYLLLDLYEFIEQHLGAGFLEGASLSPAAQALFDALEAASMPGELTGNGVDLKRPQTRESLVYPNTAYPAEQVETSLVAALRRIVSFRPALERAHTSFDLPGKNGARPAAWPDFLFLFADPWFGVLQPSPPPGFRTQEGDYLAEKVQARIGWLATLVEAALAELPRPASLPEPALATMTPADMRDGWYVIRLVYECPGCTPFHAPVVSAPTALFQMAGFFDPDAPARPIRIGLPVDISPAGLRKFDRNTAFMLSDMLCGQVDRMKGITLADLVLSVLPWPFHKDLNVPEKGDCREGDQPLGVMCSLSIPIITICALLLLMIIVSVLDFFFRWIPYFIVCFPLPGFKGRKEG